MFLPFAPSARRFPRLSVSFQLLPGTRFVFRMFWCPPFSFFAFSHLVVVISKVLLPCLISPPVHTLVRQCMHACRVRPFCAMVSTHAGKSMCTVCWLECFVA